MSKQKNINPSNKRSAASADDEVDADRGTGTVARAVRVMRALADADGDVSISNLAQRLALPPSTVHRLLDLLAGEGVVEHDDVLRMYRPGLEFYRIAASVYTRMPVRSIALPFLQDAAHENNESAYLALLDSQQGKLIFAATAESQALLSYRITLNQLQSLVTGASGLSILAWMKEEEIDRIHRREADQVASPARADLFKELAEVRENGFALTFGQRIKGAVGICAPVFNARASVIGSLGYTIPDVRYQQSLLPKLSDAVMRHANALSKALGCLQIPTPGGTFANQELKK